METREPQYKCCFDLLEKCGIQTFGLMSNYTWYSDPKRLVFMLARYKFVAKMFSGMRRILEVGCGDAFGTRIVLQEVKYLTAVDYDPIFVEDTKRRMIREWEFECVQHDMLEGPIGGDYDGAYCLDVIEHIRKEEETRFLKNIVGSLNPFGSLVIGTPSLQSQQYASAESKEGHINCKNHIQLKGLLNRFFHNIFIFSMNDEVVHTGFYPMAHYLLALCCFKKQKIDD